jgi:hypothetical protein
VGQAGGKIKAQQGATAFIPGIQARSTGKEETAGAIAYLKFLIILIDCCLIKRVVVVVHIWRSTPPFGENKNPGLFRPGPPDQGNRLPDHVFCEFQVLVPV